MRRKIWTFLLTLLCLALAALLIYQQHAMDLQAQRGVMSVVTSFAEDTGELVNPYIGNAVWADGDATYEQPFTLVYANVTWAELEPQEGEYDFAAFEERMNFERWRSQGKHLILRFVMDIPGDLPHADIPAWLMEKTVGKAYDVEYGKGYCPDYTDETLIAAHQRVIQALGERYRDDPFVAYIQLGSLGHWGEWHVHEDAGTMPLEEVRDRYAQHYLDAFAGGKQFLMMRRPFRFAAEHGLGLYNDTAGKESSTQTWLDWIAQGGAYDATGEEAALSAMPDGWKIAPIGGELATSMTKEEMLSEELLPTTIDLFERSHTSWMGPGSFKRVERDGPYQSALDQLMRRIGYRLRVTEAKLSVDRDQRMSLETSWTNDGVAPFYFDWDACVRLTHADGSVSTEKLDFALIDLLPGTTLHASVTLPEDTRMVEVGIVDPTTQAAGVQLAMQAACQDNWYCVMEIQR